MKVCIIGASGKLGRYMVRHTLDRGYEVVGVCRERSVGKLDAFKGRITVIEEADPEGLPRALESLAGLPASRFVPGHGPPCAPRSSRSRRSGTPRWSASSPPRPLPRRRGQLCAPAGPASCSRWRSRPRWPSWGRAGAGSPSGEPREDAATGLVMVMKDGYDMAMKLVNIAELKNRLGFYLRAVRRGEPVLVRDRDRVIARIEPAGGRAAAGGNAEERLADLERRGIVRRGRGRITPELLTRRVRPRRPADAVSALLREREEGP